MVDEAGVATAWALGFGLYEDKVEGGLLELLHDEAAEAAGLGIL